MLVSARALPVRLQHVIRIGQTDHGAGFADDLAVTFEAHAMLLVGSDAAMGKKKAAHRASGGRPSDAATTSATLTVRPRRQPFRRW